GWVSTHHVAGPKERDNGRNILNDFEGHLLVKPRVDRVRYRHVKHRVAIWAGPYGLGRAEVAAASRAVFYDEWLAEPLRKQLTEQPTMHIVRASRGERDDDAYRPRWIGLRSCNTRPGRQRGSAGGQMQKSSAGKFQLEPPSHHSITSSTVARSCAGTSRPSALAVCMLMMNSNLVDCTTGRSTGFAPLRILPV